MEVNRFAGIVHTGFMGHDALNPFVGQMVPFAVFDKNGTGFDETEGHIMGNAFSAQLFYPVKIAGPCAVIIFASADDLLDLTAFQVGFYGDGTDEGGTHNSLVLKWKIKQDRDSLLGAALIFTGDIEHDIFPSIAPIPGKAGQDALGTFGQQKEFYIRPLAHDFPGIIPPFICFLQKEVRGHTDADQFAALDFITASPLFQQRILKAGFCPVDVCTAAVPHAIQKVHIAVLASFAAFHAAMPGIPYIVHKRMAPFRTPSNFVFYDDTRGFGISQGKRDL